MTPPAIAANCEARTIRRANRTDHGRDTMAKTPAKKTAKKTEADDETELPLVAQVKRAIDDSGRTRSAVAIAAGITPSIVEKFMNGKCGITLGTAAKILKVLGYHVVKIDER